MRSSVVRYMPLPTIDDSGDDKLNGRKHQQQQHQHVRSNQRDSLRSTIGICVMVTCFYLYFTLSSDHNHYNNYIPKTNHSNNIPSTPATTAITTTITTKLLNPENPETTEHTNEAETQTTIIDKTSNDNDDDDNDDVVDDDVDADEFLRIVKTEDVPNELLIINEKAAKANENASSSTTTTTSGGSRKSQIPSANTTGSEVARNLPSSTIDLKKMTTPATTTTTTTTTMMIASFQNAATTANISLIKKKNSTMTAAMLTTPTTTTRNTTTTTTTTTTARTKTLATLKMGQTPNITIATSQLLKSPPSPPSSSSSSSSLEYLRDFYVYTSQCHMPRVTPFTPQIRKRFKPLSTAHCAKDATIVSSMYMKNKQYYILHINHTVALKLASQKFKTKKSIEMNAISCCYSEVIRSGGKGDKADRKATVLGCSVFHDNFVVPLHVDAAIIKCSAKDTAGKKSKSIELQKDALSFVQYRNATTSKRTTSSNRLPNVLLFGIDSLSRFNFRRNMPHTLSMLQEQKWFELEGYNKVGDNTFPNIMALLAGFNETYAYSTCKPQLVGGLDKCPFIWKRFKEAGYRTAYAEDTATISTFNYLKKGFVDPPTDHYLRPLALAIEKELPKTLKAGLPFCVGRKQYGEYIYDFAEQFTQTYANEPQFGLFWTNSFTHNAYDVSSSMDLRIAEYLHAFQRDGILDNSVVLFFSDHGIRFGSILQLPSGFLEERLPMLFISLPPWLQRSHPEFVQAIEMNRNLLTTPYDIYLTLIELLELSTSDNSSVTQQPQATADSCPRCQSLFRPVPVTRTCQEISIPTHWCTCNPFQPLPKNNTISDRIADAIIEKINVYTAEKDVKKVCNKLILKEIQQSEIQINFPNEDISKKNSTNSTNYRVKLLANPFNASFQATAKVYNATGKISIDIAVNDISRLDLYKSHSKCINDKELKKFCLC